ncbi:MAG: hypothetical protein AAFP76_15775 [Bacteroidota bacterium]
MDIIKVASGLACSCLLLLLTLLVFIKNPEKTLFEKTVQTIRTEEGLSSVQETLDHFPKLREIKVKMERIGYLSRNIHMLTAGPAPNLSKVESRQLQEYSDEIYQLRKSVKVELTLFIEGYSDRQTQDEISSKFAKSP